MLVFCLVFNNFSFYPAKNSLWPPPPPDRMRCFKSDWPGLCLFCCYQPSCVVSHQSWFWAFINFFRFTPPPANPTVCPCGCSSQWFATYLLRSRRGWRSTQDQLAHGDWPNPWGVCIPCFYFSKSIFWFYYWYSFDFYFSSQHQASPGNLQAFESFIFGSSGESATPTIATVSIPSVANNVRGGGLHWFKKDW